ncbi:hypothetical protein PIROE2DRAFT_1055, partial [Piromyces sp. E2]
NNNNILEELREIRKKQYEDSLLLRKRKSSKVKKEKKDDTVDESEIQPLLESETPIEQTKIENTSTENDNEKTPTENNDNSSMGKQQDLANERRKNKGIESKDSKILHYLLIFYYNLKTLYSFIYMFIHSLFSMNNDNNDE